MTTLPDSIGNLVNLDDLYFDMIQVVDEQSFEIFARLYREFGEFEVFVLSYDLGIWMKIS